MINKTKLTRLHGRLNNCNKTTIQNWICDAKDKVGENLRIHVKTSEEKKREKREHSRECQDVKEEENRDVTSGMLSQRSLESTGISKSWNAIMKINQTKPTNQTKPERHSWTLSSEIYDQQDKEEDTRSPQTWEKPPFQRHQNKNGS